MPKFNANIPTSSEVLQGKKLPVMEAFYTLQGEGKYAGQAAYFIRLAGCDVGCVWCDVKDSWDASQHPVMAVEQIVEEAVKHPAEIVVITGGEPLMFDLSVLTAQLKAAGKRTHIETSGAHPLSGTWDWITFSPKKFKAPLDEFFEKSHELKIVIFHKSDLKWAEDLAARCTSNIDLLLQPEWSKSETNVPLLIDYVKQFPKWRLSLQTHKFVGIP